MKLFYLATMRYAPGILFTIGVLSALTQLAGGLTAFSEFGRAAPFMDSYDSTSRIWLITVLGKALAPALNALVWPWLGAAALWRFDGIYLRRRSAPAQETAE